MRLKSSTSRLTARQARGRASEQLACAYLRRQGYVIEATNVRFPVGELDIIAREGGTLCVVEVRSRSSEQFGSALESITAAKRRHFIRATRWYLRRRHPGWTGPVRFDVVAIRDHLSTPPSIELVRGAFEADEPGWAD